jgi:hypothetical protein
LANFAVNNDSAAYPAIRASFSGAKSSVSHLVDGNYWYHESPPNRWTTVGSPNSRDTVMIDFGAPRLVEQLKLYFLDDGANAPVRAPARYVVEMWSGDRWVEASVIQRKPTEPMGHRPNTVSLEPQAVTRMRVILEPQHGAAVGMTELEAWGRSPANRVVDAAW